MRKSYLLGATCVALTTLLVSVLVPALTRIEIPPTETTSAPPLGADDIEARVIEAIKTEGSAEAVRMYEVLLEQNPDLAYGCHSGAHRIGQFAALEDGPDATVTLAPGLCQGGFLHGVLQVAASSTSMYSGICNKLDVPDRSACAHGYGHLLAVEYPSSIDAALRVCTQFYNPASVDTGKLASRCGGGAAMEYGASFAFYSGVAAVASREGHMGPVELQRVTLPPNELSRPCRVLQDFSTTLAEVHHECVSHLAFFFMSDPDAAPAEMHDRCRIAAPQATEFSLCMQSVGLRIVERHTLASTANKTVPSATAAVRDLCISIPTAAQRHCAVGGYLSVMNLGPETLTVPCLTKWQPASCREAQEITAAAMQQ